MARELALPVFDKKDSTGICFIGERPFAEFLAQLSARAARRHRDAEGRKVGEHRGLMYYTLGQRQGLRIGGRNDAAEEAWYVADKDLQRNVLVVVQGHDHPALFSRGLTASQLAWVAGEAAGGAVPTAQPRSGIASPIRLARSACSRTGVAQSNSTQPQRAVTPGQYVVFYRGEECLGGGVIEASHGASPAAIIRPRFGGRSPGCHTC